MSAPGTSASAGGGSGDAWYFTREQLASSPSRRCGLDADKELSYRQQAANLIQDMGQRLQVSQLCINTAIVYMHRFYAFHSFTHFHRNSMAAAALFLAAKVEEQPRKLEYVIKVAHVCLHRGESAASLDPRSEHYQEQAQDLVFNENVLLQTLGFDVAIDHPHTHVVRSCHLIKAPKDLAQTSYFMASNSLHLTTMCLQYKPTVVACFCIHLASKWSNWQIPQSNEGRHWFSYVDRGVTTELLEKLTAEFLHIFDKCPSRLKRWMRTISSSSSSPHSGGQQPSTSQSPFDAKKQQMMMADDMEKSFDREYEREKRRSIQPGGYIAAAASQSQPQNQHPPHPNQHTSQHAGQHSNQHASQSNQHSSQSNQHAIQSNQHVIQSNQHAIQSNQHSNQSNQHPNQSTQHANQHASQPNQSNHPSSQQPHKMDTREYWKRQERDRRQAMQQQQQPKQQQPPPSRPPAPPGHSRPDQHKPHGWQHHGRPPHHKPPPEHAHKQRQAAKEAGAAPPAAHAAPNNPEPKVEPPPQRTRPPSLFSPENATAPSAAAAAPRRPPAPPPQRRPQPPAPPHTPPPAKRPVDPASQAVREMQPPAAVSPLSSPPPQKQRTRNSSSSEPELVPVVKKLEETPGYENLMRAAAARRAPQKLPSPVRPANGIETDPTLVSNLLKESLARPVTITPPVERQAPKPPSRLPTPVEQRPAAQPATQPETAAPTVQPVEQQPEHRHKSEKKKKKEKHKHKDRDKSKEERKKHKKDKEREKKREEPVPEAPQIDTSGLRITIPRDKLSGDGLKIKIPKERFTAPPPPQRPLAALQTPPAPPPTAPAQPPPQVPAGPAGQQWQPHQHASGIKIKIPKEVLETSRKRALDSLPQTAPPHKQFRHNGHHKVEGGSGHGSGNAHAHANGHGK